MPKRNPPQAQSSRPRGPLSAPTPGMSADCVGADYSDDEREFMVALDRWKRARHRPFPTSREVLAVLRSLGWRKVEAAGPLPGDEPPAPLPAGAVPCGDCGVKPRYTRGRCWGCYRKRLKLVQAGKVKW